MDLVTKSETEILGDLFNPDRLSKLRYRWVNGAAALYKAGDIPVTLETANKLPNTELALAKEVGLFLKGKVVYVKTEQAWYVHDGVDFIKTEGDWFIHKVIKETAGVYGGITDDVFKKYSRKKAATAEELAKEEENDPLDKFKEHFRLNGKLQGASALDAYSKLLKTELDEAPEGMVKDADFLTVDYLAVREALPHLVQDHIPSVGIGQLYGQSSAGKTIAMVDLALSICAGLDTWQGLPLKTDGPSFVLYVAAEGGQPFWDMVEAWKAKHPSADVSRLLVWDAAEGQSLTVGTTLEIAPGLFGLRAMKEKITKAGIDLTLAVFDPQANILSGVDENSNVDMVAALKPIQDWALEGKFLALLIHHEGKTDTGSGRGASSQKAMMDLLIKLKRNATGTRTLSFEKVKGSKDPDKKLNYVIETVHFEGGSGSGGVAIPEGPQLSIAERQERVGLLDEIKVREAINAGCTSALKIAEKTSLNRNVVSEHLATLEYKGIIQNLGNDSRPKWMMVSTDSDD